MRYPAYNSGKATKMNRKSKADTVRVMGLKWIWNYTDRRWVADSTIGKWSLWYDGTRWKLESPNGAIYTFLRQHRYEAMVQAGYTIANVKRYMAGR
jgi:hypothetical protein